MKLLPKYSYEFNCILNESFNEIDQIKNFTSIISDKDRFLSLLPLIENNQELIEKTLGFDLFIEIDFYVVRAERFKSFSEPITVEYSILPEEMILFLLKEIIKTCVKIRFPDELSREQYCNSFVNHIIVNGNFDGQNFIKFIKNLDNESKRLYPEYEFKDIDFNSKTMKECLESMYKENV